MRRRTGNLEFPYSGLLILAGFIIISLINFRISNPPEVVSGDSSEYVFSAERAARHLTPIASFPNPTGTSANDYAREYIIQQIEALGLEAEIQTTLWYHEGRMARLGNVMTRLQGSGTGRAVLFMGHFDTVASAPGASDNAAAVVTLLELIRLLQHHPQMINDFIFLFPDAEEYGLLGAQAFLAEHPWAGDIDVVVNLEAMGTSGPSMLFETGEKNLEVIRLFASAVPFPYGYSLAVEIYNRMPNATDFTVFLRAGYQGLNFVYIANSFDYHTQGDNIENTDLRSIQHHGEHAAALAIALGNHSLELESDQNAVYFNTLGFGFAVYPFSWVPVIAIILVLMIVILLIAAFSFKIINPWKMLAAFISFAVLILLHFELFNYITEIIFSFFKGNDSRLVIYRQQYVVMGFLLMAAAFSAFYYHIITKGVRLTQLMPLLLLGLMLMIWSGSFGWIRFLVAFAIALWLLLAHRLPMILADLWSGIIIFLALLTVIASVVFRGGSYLFTWPLAFSIIPFAMVLFSKKETPAGLGSVLLLLLFALPAIAWFPIHISEFTWAMSVRQAGIAMIFAALLFGFLAPHLYLMIRYRPWVLPSIIAAAGLAIVIVGVSTSSYNERYRRNNLIVFVSDANNQQTFWMTYDDRVDEWTAQFLGSEPDTLPLERIIPYSRATVLGAESSLPLLPATSVIVIADSISNGERILVLEISPGSPGSEIWMYISAGQGSVSMAYEELGRHELPRIGQTDWHRLLYLAPEEAFAITFYSQPEDEFLLHVNEVEFWGETPPFEFEPRPLHMMSRADRSINSKYFMF
jgi:hypothetical protein